MEITCPVKRASFPMAQQNHDLHSIGDLKRCQTQGFGSNPQTYGPGGHNGLDFSYEEGTELFSPVSGFAYYKEEPKGYGKYLTIVGEGYKIVLAHLKERLIPDGSVQRGQLIAHGDSTGFSTGNHLHMTVKKVDSNGNVLDRLNGHDGAIDPTPLLVWFGMTKEEVEKLQALEGYKDAEGVEYWKDKPLSAYLEARLKDKVKTINELLNV